MAGPVQHSLALPQGDLCWFEWGTPSDQTSLLLLHATGFHARVWDAVVAALPSGTHVIAPDLPGHGRSFRPDSLSDWSIFPDAVLPLLRSINSRTVVGVGHSMGGHCLNRLASDEPYLFSHALLIDPVIVAPDHRRQLLTTADPADHPVAKRRNQWATAAEMIERFSTREPYCRWDSDVLADYCHWGLVSAEQGNGLELACPPLLEASCYIGSMSDGLSSNFKGVACLVTVLRAPQRERASAMDFSVSPTWPALAYQYDFGRDILWDDVTHFIPMEQPARVAQLIADLIN